MFKRYFLVELVAYNNVKSVRSNCVIEGWKLPPLELVFKNCVNIGYPSVNILSVTRISKKTAREIKNHINSISSYNNKAMEEVVKQVMKGDEGTNE